MPEQSVKQFRPDAMERFDGGTIFDFEDDWDVVRAYIERLENALGHIAWRIKDTGVEYIAIDGSLGSAKVIGYSPHAAPSPWVFVTGRGETFIEAIENDM